MKKKRSKIVRAVLWFGKFCIDTLVTWSDQASYRALPLLPLDRYPPGASLAVRSAMYRDWLRRNISYLSHAGDARGAIKVQRKLDAFNKAQAEEVTKVSK